SCDETKYWLEFAKDIDLLEFGQFEELFTKCERLSKMISSLLTP
ncbi:MAG: four helix bundle protein, partial [Acidobacteriota bacterium]